MQKFGCWGLNLHIQICFDRVLIHVRLKQNSAPVISVLTWSKIWTVQILKLRLISGLKWVNYTHQVGPSMKEKPSPIEKSHGSILCMQSNQLACRSAVISWSFHKDQGSSLDRDVWDSGYENIVQKVCMQSQIVKQNVKIHISDKHERPFYARGC